MNQKNNQLQAMRHSCEHVLTQAMYRLYPQIKMAMGPATDTGFYFDFDPQDHQISEKDFPKIEKEMNKIIKADLPLVKKQVSLKKAREIFTNNPYKQEWLDEISKRQEKVSVYWTGDPKDKNSFVDLCSGPHLKSTGKIGAFKLLSVAGAYWRGDESNKMLTRIYGTCFPTKKELKQYLWQLKEAKKRDHRVLGQKLELFMFDDEVGQGLPLYLPKGARLRHLLKEFALNTYLENGYELVSTPHIGSEKLWQKSGHLDFYADSMYGPLSVDEDHYRLKPMNCPFHVKMYNLKTRSYRELPIRWSEMGTVYRYEKSGELHGLTRPRGFTQDDAHIICTPEQLEPELLSALKLIRFIYESVGMQNLSYKLSTRDPENKNKYIGSDAAWKKAQQALKSALKKSGIKDYELDEGGAAFYAPKIDIDAIDSMQRQWQLSTIQIDFNLPKRFEMKYVGKDNQEHQPFMIHRALLGSLERFLGVYIEHTNGAFPVFLSPVQVVVIPISQDQHQYAQKITQKLKADGVRVNLDDALSSMQKRIRQAEIQRVPYILVVGKKEQQKNQVNLRVRGKKQTQMISLEQFVSLVSKAVDQKLSE